MFHSSITHFQQCEREVAFTWQANQGDMVILGLSEPYHRPKKIEKFRSMPYWCSPRSRSRRPSMPPPHPDGSPACLPSSQRCLLALTKRSRPALPRRCPCPCCCCRRRRCCCCCCLRPCRAPVRSHTRRYVQLAPGSGRADDRLERAGSVADQLLSPSLPPSSGGRRPALPAGYAACPSSHRPRALL